MNKWYSGEGKNSDVVVGATVRLARNLADAPFPIRMNNEIRRNTVKKIFAAVKNSPYAGEFDLVDLSAVSSAQAYAYAEQQLISRRFARQKEQSAFLLSKDGSASVMLCEEDHIRLQVRAAGQDLEGAYAKADKLDDALLERLPIAFDERLGFLTAVPTNLGTGMQAMLDLHLPALAGQGLIDQLTVMIGKLGLSLQPLYDGHGSFYRLTNPVTLGITEKAAIDNVNAICDQIVGQERNLRQQLQQQDAFLDRIYRAMGTLQMARTLNQDEFFDLVSLLRLGISLGESSKTYSDVGELIQKVQNATIAAAAGAEGTADAVDKIRAGLVRQALA